LVSRAGARDDYGVVLVDDEPVVDEPASDALRAERRAARGEQPFFDRGPGYARLAAGATSADVDWISPQESASYARSAHSGHASPGTPNA
jgi:N-methylhydantoinase B